MICSGQHEEWVILVHGTLGLRQNLELRTFLSLFKEDISNTHYHHTIKIMRSDPFLFENQPIQKTGFHEIITGNSSHGASLFVKLYKELHCDEKNGMRFFTFGWSGLVSSKIRYQEAEIFYRELKTALLSFFKQHGYFPKITIIGYSHGGNVCLNLAAIRKLHPEDTFSIDTLILLGTPIQKETDYLILEPIFTQIYNVHSRGDRIQRLDCFSFKRFFSKRRFKPCRRYTLPTKLKQIEVRLKHTDRTRVIDRSPGHIELWFFGWPENHKSLYRPHFPFHPLPFSLFIPELIRQANECSTHHDIIAELRAPSGNLCLWNRNSYKKNTTSFLSQEKIAHLQRLARRYKPLVYSAEIYKAHVQSAVELARILRCSNRKQSKKSLCGA